VVFAATWRERASSDRVGGFPVDGDRSYQFPAADRQHQDVAAPGLKGGVVGNPADPGAGPIILVGEGDMLGVGDRVAGDGLELADDGGVRLVGSRQVTLQPFAHGPSAPAVPRDNRGRQTSHDASDVVALAVHRAYSFNCFSH